MFFIAVRDPPPSSSSPAHANSQSGVSVCCVLVGVLVALAPQARVLHMPKQTTSAKQTSLRRQVGWDEGRLTAAECPALIGALFYERRLGWDR